MGFQAAIRSRISFLLASAVALALLLPVGNAEATFPGDNGKIAFASNSSGNYEIYTVNLDGTGLTNLTNSSDHENYPAWSADGRKIVYTKNDSVDPLCGLLWTMNADGTNKTQISPPRYGWEPAWSPDGQKIAAGACGDEIYTINSDGSGYQWVFLVDGDDGEYGVEWSPDGQRIVFATHPGTRDAPFITTVKPDGSDWTDISPVPAHNTSMFPSWSPDGAKVAYYFDIVSTQESGIGTANQDGTGHDPIKETSSLPSGLAWSPDMTKIVYADSGALYTMNSDGSGAAALPGGLTGAGRPDWQPLRPPGYARPKTATPTSIRLVPAHEACTNPNAHHGAPLAIPSCNPPLRASDYLTVGTQDVNEKAANSVGYLTARTLTESPIDPTNGDQSDVAFTVSVTDVADKQSPLVDYTGELRASFGLRLTDRRNGPGAVHPATTVDTSFGFSFSCSPVAGDVGSTCSASTSADAVMPGVTPESKRAIWQLGQVQVYDGGSDGDGDTTGDNTLFAVQGLFTP